MVVVSSKVFTGPGGGDLGAGVGYRHQYSSVISLLSG